MKTMSSLVAGLLCIILILSVAYLIKRVNKLIDYVLGKDNSLLNFNFPDTSYTELFRHPENYIDYRIDSIPNNLKESD